MNAYSIKHQFRDETYSHTFYAENEKQAEFLADVLGMYFGGTVSYDGQLIESGDYCLKCGKTENIKTYLPDVWEEFIER